MLPSYISWHIREARQLPLRIVLKLVLSESQGVGIERQCLIRSLALSSDAIMSWEIRQALDSPGMGHTRANVAVLSSQRIRWSALSSSTSEQVTINKWAPRAKAMCRWSNSERCRSVDLYMAWTSNVEAQKTRLKQRGLAEYSRRRTFRSSISIRKTAWGYRSMVFGTLGRIGRTSGNKAARNCGYTSVVPDLTSSTTKQNKPRERLA